jgi:hypothetical protein
MVRHCTGIIIRKKVLASAQFSSVQRTFFRYKGRANWD